MRKLLVSLNAMLRHGEFWRNEEPAAGSAPEINQPSPDRAPSVITPDADSAAPGGDDRHSAEDLLSGSG